MQTPVRLICSAFFLTLNRCAGSDNVLTLKRADESPIHDVYESHPLEHGTVDALLLFLDLLRLDLLPPLVVGELALGVHLLVLMFPHCHLTPDASLDTSWVLDCIRRQDFHEVCQAD